MNLFKFIQESKFVCVNGAGNLEIWERKVIEGDWWWCVHFPAIEAYAFYSREGQCFMTTFFTQTTPFENGREILSEL